MVKPQSLSRAPGIVSEALHTLVSQIPTSSEPLNPNPEERVKSLAKMAALKAAAISGTFTLPPGPFGMATVLPDLLAVWRIQQQLVADVAAVFGKTSALTSETMVICLFKHGGAALTKPLFARQDHEIVVQRIAGRTLLQLLEKIAVRVAQRIAAKSLSRWLPIVGALGAGAYAYYDTAHVATNASELFSRNLRIQSDSDATDAPAEAAIPPTRATRARRTKSDSKPTRSKPAAKPRVKPESGESKSKGRQSKSAKGGRKPAPRAPRSLEET
jgi:hypothetical protein